MVVLWWSLVTSAALAADPAVHVTWRGDDGRLFVRAPEGEHIAPEAPFDVTLTIGTRSVVLTGFGTDLEPGVPVGAVRGSVIDGALRVSLCEDGGSRCRLAEVTVRGAIDARRRGTATLALGSVALDEDDGFPARADAGRVYEQALADAKSRELPILLDFGAVWCPPCQLMDVEVFDATPRASVVGAFVLAQLDVDDPTSWTLKDRYGVGGYPTLVAVDVTGRELGRLVGYPGPDETVAWMDAVATGRYLDPGGTHAPEVAARLALQAVLEGRPDAAAPYLATAAAQPELVEFRLARLLVKPTLEDARWLAERAPGRALDWVMSVGDLTADPAGRDVVLSAIRADLSTASALDAADLLYAAAELTEDAAEARTLYGAAAALVRTRLNGDPKHDKGHYNWLAVLTERAGRADDAVKILEGARDAFPDEPTFHAYLARLHLRQQHAEEALSSAERALDTGWGDNRLTAAKVKVEALLALGRKADARAFVDEILLTLPAPEAGVDVRTTRHRDELRALVQ